MKLNFARNHFYYTSELFESLVSMGNPQNRQQKRRCGFKINQHTNQQKNRKVVNQKQTLRARNVSEQCYEGDGDSFLMLIDFEILKKLCTLLPLRVFLTIFDFLPC